MGGVVPSLPVCSTERRSAQSGVLSSNTGYLFLFSWGVGLGCGEDGVESGPFDFEAEVGGEFFDFVAVFVGVSLPCGGGDLFKPDAFVAGWLRMVWRTLVEDEVGTAVDGAFLASGVEVDEFLHCCGELVEWDVAGLEPGFGACCSGIELAADVFEVCGGGCVAGVFGGGGGGDCCGGGDGGSGDSEVL